MSRPGRRRGDRMATAAGARTVERARLRLTRLRVVVVLTVLLGLAQVLFEEVVLFVATTGDGLTGPLSSPVVAIGVPLTIAALLLVVLVGGALWYHDDERARRRSFPGRDDPEQSEADDHRDSDP